MGRETEETRKTATKWTERSGVSLIEVDGEHLWQWNAIERMSGSTCDGIVAKMQLELTSIKRKRKRSTQNIEKDTLN